MVNSPRLCCDNLINEPEPELKKDEDSFLLPTLLLDLSVSLPSFLNLLSKSQTIALAPDGYFFSHQVIIHGIDLGTWSHKAHFDKYY